MKLSAFFPIPAAVGIALSLCVVSPVLGDNLTWDANTTTAGAQDGATATSVPPGLQWVAGGGNFYNNTNTTDNWFFTNGDNVTFGANSGPLAAGVVEVNGTVVVGGTGPGQLLFATPSSGSYTLNNGTISFGGTTNAIISNADSTINSTITAGGAIFTFEGSAVTTLGGVNSLSPFVFIDNARVRITNKASAGTGTLLMSGSNSELLIGSSVAGNFSNNFLISDGGTSKTVTHESGGSDVTLTGSVTVGTTSAGSLTVNNQNTAGGTVLTFGSSISGGADGVVAIDVVGSGDVEFTNIGSLVGDVRVSSGSEIFVSGNNIASDVLLNNTNATLRMGDGVAVTGAGNVVVGGTGNQKFVVADAGGVATINGGILVNDGDTNAFNARLVAETGARLVVNGIIGGTGATDLELIGPGTIELNGNNSFSGDAVQIDDNGSGNSATVIAGHNNAFSGAAVELRGPNGAILVKDGIDVGNSITIASDAGKRTLGLQTGATTGEFSGNVSVAETTAGDFELNAGLGGTLTVSGDVTGNAIEKVGVGTVLLSGNNTYTGETIVTSGTLQVSNGNGIGNSSAVTLADTAGAGLELLSDETVGSIAGGGATGGNINLNGNRLTTGGNDTNTSFDGLVSGAGGSLEKVGNGSLALSRANTFDGGFILGDGDSSTGNTPSGGSVVVSNNAALGSGTVTARGDQLQAASAGIVLANDVNIEAGNLNLGGSQSFEIGGQVTTVGGDRTIGNFGNEGTNITLSSGLALSGGSITVSGNDGEDNGNLLISGNITEAGGARSLTIDSTYDQGVVELSGTNTYKGATSVNSGTLLINGDNSAATGAVTVASGATLGGSGFIGGDTTISGIHNPGNSPGIQTFGGNLTYGPGGESPVINWQLIGNTTSGPGVNFDRIMVGGNLNFAASTTLNLDFNSAGSTVDWTDSFWGLHNIREWQIFGVYGASSTVSNFANLDLNVINWPDSNLALFDSNTPAPSNFYLFQDAGGSIYLRYEALPEPTTFSLLGLLLGTLTVLTRRRRRLQ